MKWIPRSKSGASKSRPRWAAHTRIGNVWEYPSGVQAAHNNHRGLKRLIGQPHLGDYIKGSGIAHPTQLHKTFTHKKTSIKRKTAKES